MDILGILEPDTDPRENLCGSETLIAVEGNILCLTEDSTGATRTEVIKFFIKFLR